MTNKTHRLLSAALMGFGLFLAPTAALAGVFVL